MNESLLDCLNSKNIFSKEKQLRNSIKLSKLRRKNELDNFQAIYHKNTFDQSSTLYLTEQIKTDTTDEITYSNSKLTKKSFISNVSKKNFNSTNSIFFQKDPNLLKAKMPYESLTQFRSKLKESFYLNFKKSVINEACLREVEAIQNKIDFYHENYEFYKKTKNFLENSFLINFERYSKMLTAQKKRENDQLEVLLNRKGVLDIEIKQLEHKISKLVETYNSNKEYRNIIMCVKERKTVNELVEDSKFSTLNFNRTIESVDKRKKSFLKNKNSILKNENRVSILINPNIINYANLVVNKNYSPLSKSQRPSKKNSFANSTKASVNTNIPKTRNCLDEYFKSNYSENSRIFNDYSELVGEIKKLETDNIQLLNKLNDMTILVKNMRDKRTNFIEDINNIEDDNEINKKIQEISELKLRLNQMAEKRDKYLNLKNQQNKRNFLKTRFKIKKIFESIFLRLNRQMKIENELEMMQYLEEASINLIKKYEASSRSFPNEVYRAEKEMDKERKYIYAQEQIRSNFLKGEIMRKNVMEKFEKVIVLPKRKVVNHLKPQRISPFKKVQNNNDCDIQDLLSYEND